MTGGRTTAVARLLGLVICGKARFELSIQADKSIRDSLTSMCLGLQGAWIIWQLVIGR